MKLLEIFEHGRDFAPREALVRQADRTARLKDCRFLLLLDTSHQRTWLVQTPTDLHCVFDILKEEEPRRLWSDPRAKLFKGGEVVVPIHVNPVKNDKWGYVTINGHNRRKYSKRLFLDRTVESAIRHLIAGGF